MSEICSCKLNIKMYVYVYTTHEVLYYVFKRGGSPIMQKNDENQFSPSSCSGLLVSNQQKNGSF